MPMEIWVACVGLGLLLWWLLLWLTRPMVTKERVRKAYGGWRLVYSDERGRRRRGVVYSKLLHAEKSGLTGKPDMIYEKIVGRGWMPVELKSGRIGGDDMPHEGDLLQLAAYFAIVEDVYGKRPRLGRIVYADGAFCVRNTRALRRRLADTLARMRYMLEAGEGAEEANSDYATCRYCLCKQTVCEYSYFVEESAER